MFVLHIVCEKENECKKSLKKISNSNFNFSHILVLSSSVETKIQAGRKYCRVGCGVENVAGSNQTPGFENRDEPTIKNDFLGYKKLFLKRKRPAPGYNIIQTSLYQVESWRANCDVQMFIYEDHENGFSDVDIAKVTNYIVSYACKGVEGYLEEKEQMSSLILSSQNGEGTSNDIHKIAQKI